MDHQAARAARLARFDNATKYNNVGASSNAPTSSVALDTSSSLETLTTKMTATTTARKTSSSADSTQERPSITPAGVLDCDAFAKKKRILDKKEASQTQTKRQRSVQEAGKPAEHEKVVGMTRCIGSVDQAKSAKHKKLVGMDVATKKSHFHGGLPDTNKKKKPAKKKTGVHGFRKK
jgi:hypothetical protein